MLCVGFLQSVYTVAFPTLVPFFHPPLCAYSLLYSPFSSPFFCTISWSKLIEFCSSFPARPPPTFHRVRQWRKVAAGRAKFPTLLSLNLCVEWQGRHFIYFTCPGQEKRRTPERSEKRQRSEKDGEKGNARLRPRILMKSEARSKDLAKQIITFLSGINQSTIPFWSGNGKKVNLVSPRRLFDFWD